LNNIIILNEFQSYGVYFGSIIGASLFAALSSKYFVIRKGKRCLNSIFWVISFFMLFIPLAFRGGGVDHISYVNYYNTIDNLREIYLPVYNGTPEPLFVVINYIAVYIFGNMQYVYIISALITMSFTYKAFSRMYGRINIGLCIFLFGTSYYLFMYGLVRMFIAVSIITYAYKYIEEKKTLKFIAFSCLAGLFHYSAFLMIPLYFAITYKMNYDKELLKKNRTHYFQIFFIYSAVFLVLYYLFPIVAKSFGIYERYAVYFNSSGNIFTIISIADKFFLIILVLIYKEQIYKTIINGFLYSKMLWLMVIIILFSLLLPITRLSYFFYPSCIYLYSAIPKIISNKASSASAAVGLYYIVLSIMGLSWLVYSVFSANSWVLNLIPYSFSFPI